MIYRSFVLCEEFSIFQLVSERRRRLSRTPNRDPRDLRHRIRRMQLREETFTISIDPMAKTENKVTYSGQEASLERALDLGDLIESFAMKLPARADITFTRHDQPACSLSWEHKAKMLEMAQQGECLLFLRNIFV